MMETIVLLMNMGGRYATTIENRKNGTALNVVHIDSYTTREYGLFKAKELALTIHCDLMDGDERLTWSVLDKETWKA